MGASMSTAKADQHPTAWQANEFSPVSARFVPLSGYDQHQFMVDSDLMVSSNGHLIDDARTFASKRCFDLVVSLGLAVCLSPGLLLIAAAIKLTSPGPILFRQTRYGIGGRTFEIFKFRTMSWDETDVTGVRQTCKNDPRVTRIGRLLRKSSLDELPQLLNVVRGEMSLVGPRPHVPGMQAGGVLYEELVPYYFRRHQMPVGITGLAQVSGLRGSTVDPVKATARIDHDLEYIDRWSLVLDLWIIWQTVRREFLTCSAD
jgi:polysaccharide biosynthesis protein PslA